QLEQPRPNRPDLCPRQRGAREPHPAHRLHQHVGHRGKPQPQLVGPHGGGARPIRKQPELLLLDPVFHLPARAVEILVQRGGGPSPPPPRARHPPTAPSCARRSGPPPPRPPPHRPRSPGGASRPGESPRRRCRAAGSSTPDSTRERTAPPAAHAADRPSRRDR